MDAQLSSSTLESSLTYCNETSPKSTQTSLNCQLQSNSFSTEQEIPEHDEVEELSTPYLYVSTVTRTCTMAALAASQCISELHKKATSFISNTLTSTVGYFARPLSSAWNNVSRSKLKLDELAQCDNPTVNVLGITYNASDKKGRQALLDDCRSRVIFTYRKGFDPIVRQEEPTTGCHETKYGSEPQTSCNNKTRLLSQAPAGSLPLLQKILAEDISGNIVSDAGWGCMIRATQMAVCQALISLRLGRHWRRSFHLDSSNGASPRTVISQSTSETKVTFSGSSSQTLVSKQKYNIISILSLFDDSPYSPISIHNITTYAAEILGTPVGHWLGPTSCSQAVAAVITSERFRSLFPDMVPVVFPDGLIIHSKVKEVWEKTIAAPPAVLIIICMRLGTIRLNVERYATALSICFTLRQFQGMAGGGSWVSAHYFYGNCDKGLLYLDPHSLVQPTPKLIQYQSNDVAGTNAHEDITEEEAVGSFFLSTSCNPTSSSIEDFLWISPWENVNPSLALYFLCKDSTEYEDLVARLSEISKNTATELFEMIETPLKFQESSNCNYLYLEDRSELTIPDERYNTQTGFSNTTSAKIFH